MSRLSGVALLAVACGAPVYIPKEPPPLGRFSTGATGDTGGETLGLPCSGSGWVAVTLEVDNGSDEGVGLYWLDGACVEQPYTAVGPHSRYTQPSFETHVWVARAQGSGEVVASIVLDATPVQTLVIR